MYESALVIDVGTTSTKAGIVEDRALRSLASAPNPTPHRTPGGHAEQDLEGVWRSVIDAVSALGAVSPDLITVTGQMQNLITLDSAGNALHPAILYSDTRATREHVEVTRQLGDDWQDTIGFAPDATTLPGKNRWMQRERPQIHAVAAQSLFGTHSFVVFRLCGAAAVDTTTAGTTGLFDNESRSWWPPATETVLGALPRVVDSRTPVGVLSQDAAALLGLRQGIPVVHGPGDAGAASVGAVGEDQTKSYLYVGTSGWAGRLTSSFEPKPGSLLLPSPIDDVWVRAAPVLAAGATIEWACRVLLGATPIAAIDQLIGSCCAAEQGVWFSANLGGDRITGDLGAAGSLSGLGWTTSASTIAAAVIEGVAHELLPALHGVGGDTHETVVATGGATRLAALCQAIADVTGRSVDTSGGTQATMLGAGSLALDYDLAQPHSRHPAAVVWEPIAERRQSHDRIATGRKIRAEMSTSE